MIGVSKLGCLMMAAAAVVVGLSTPSRASLIYDGGTLAPTQTGTNGQPSGVVADTVSAGAVYSNVTTFSGYSGVAGANGTTTYTDLLADDINTTATSSFTLSSFTYSIDNTATSLQTISAYVRFFAANGTNGGPGTWIAGINYGGVPISANQYATFNASVTNFGITLPPSFWACEYFSTTGSAANAQHIGEAIFNPVSVGSSTDEDFTSSSPGSLSNTFGFSYPTGSIHTSPYGGFPVANFGFEFVPVAPVPEPASLGLLGAAAMLGLRRRRAI